MTPDTMIDLHFPLAGIDVSAMFERQPNKPVIDGTYARTTPMGVNVRAYDPANNRGRGAQRPGLSKHLPVALVPGWIVQELNGIVGKGWSGNVQFSNSGRVVRLIAVSQGNVYYANAGDQVWTPANNVTGLIPPLNFTGIVYSAANQQKLWFADGINYVYYTPSTNQVNNWIALAGTLPVDSANNTPRLIATWRGRTVLSGLLLDPQNWFMSAVNAPQNFDYAPLSPSAADAVAGNNSTLGLVGDVVTSLIPYNDDVLIFGGDHTIFQMKGDPNAGGQIDLVSDAIGMAWGIPWCKDPYGAVYFVSNRMGIYTFTPGQGPPVRISQQIEKLLLDVDTGNNGIRLLWDDRFQGFHVFITNLSAPGTVGATHFFWEMRTGAWWIEQFGNPNFDPLACCVFDGNTPGDRVPVIGSWDGFVRKIDPAATTDDGTAIPSSVLIGPINTKNFDDLLLKDLQAVMGITSGQVNYDVFLGTSAEQALANGSVASGTWGPGRNLSTFVRGAAHAIYVRISATNPWAMESIRARVSGQGKVRMRGI